MTSAYDCKSCGIRCLAYTKELHGFCDHCYARMRAFWRSVGGG